MQDVSPWPESFDVSQPVARVLVDGQEFDVESVSVSSELDSAMPERVAAGGGGVVAATGNASVLRPDDVFDAGFNPWGDAQQFVESTDVVVEAGYRDPEIGEEGYAQQLTGQVESLDGGATSNTVQLEFTDHTPQLDRDISIEPLLRVDPPLEDWGPMRGAGLSPIYITDRVLRHCGFYATPPRIPAALLSVPLMGSAVPELGTLTAGWAESSTSSPAAFRPAPWGMGLGNGVLTYDTWLRSSRGHGRFTETLHVSFQLDPVAESNSAQSYIELRWGSVQDVVRVSVFWDGRIRVWYGQSGTLTPVATLSAGNVHASEAFTVSITPSGEATIFASNGTTATGSGQLSPRLASRDMDEIHVRVPQSSHTLGGLQVAFTEHKTHMFQRTAHIDPPSHYYSMEAFPWQNNVNCSAIQSAKDCSSAAPPKPG